VEIRTSSRTLATPTIVQLVVVIKPINPLRGGTCLKIISLHVQTFTILKEGRKRINACSHSGSFKPTH
jgi:hypothetical protein